MAADQLPLSQQITCSPAQACAALGVGKTALYALLADDAIQSFKVNNSKKRLIVVASLHEWVRAQLSYGFGNDLKGGY